MQIYASSWHCYLLALPCIPVIIGANLSVSHSIALVIWSLLLSVGVSTQIYYNMAVCVLLGVLLTLMNLSHTHQIISQLDMPDFFLTGQKILQSQTLYWNLIEGVILILGTKYSFKKYVEYRANMKNQL